MPGSTSCASRRPTLRQDRGAPIAGMLIVVAPKAGLAMLTAADDREQTAW